MKTEYHLVLIGTLDLFHEWQHNMCLKVQGDFTYKKYHKQLKIYKDGMEYVFTPFTPYMDKENLRGCRFKSIINGIGLSDKELSWFNSFVREWL